MAHVDHNPPRYSGDRLVGMPTHPMSAGIGAITAAATGAVVGSAGGPVGTVVGAMVGAVIGGLGCDAIASSLGEAQDAADLRARHPRLSHARADRLTAGNGQAHVVAQPARQRLVDGDRVLDTLSQELAHDRHTSRNTFQMTWEDAEPAIRDAWERRQGRLREPAYWFRSIWPGTARPPWRSRARARLRRIQRALVRVVIRSMAARASGAPNSQNGKAAIQWA